MLTVILGTDWIQNQDEIMRRIANDVRNEKPSRVLIVPELVSHETERLLCATAGDSASRYAEVLPFTRLYRRVCEVLGIGTTECLDNGGRVIAMAAAARQLHSRLKAYASVETRPEFLTGLVDAVDEFKRCCISADDLMEASKQTEGALAQKLDELSMLLYTYDSLCANGKRDAADQMTWLLEELESSSYAHEHVFYIDGFPDFTRQHMAILQNLICNSPEVVITFNCDVPDSDNPAFETAGKTVGEILRFARRNDIPCSIIKIPARNDRLLSVRNSLFRGAIQESIDLHDILFVQQFHSIHEECLAAAERIRQLVQSGCRFRDIGVVCSDIGKYQNTLQMVFARCHTPLYLSGTENILDKPVIVTVLSALEAALNGFDQQDILRYAKSMLSPVDIDAVDMLENYVILWNIHGTRWFRDWTFNPNGLDSDWDEESEKLLRQINHTRAKIVEPLLRLHRNFREAERVADQVVALYRFFTDIHLAEGLDDLADKFISSGDPRNAQIMNQLWEILLGAMEQMHDVLGQLSWDYETFARLLRLLLTQYDVGTIPPVLDSVMAGPVSVMRCHKRKHLIVLGALEGQLPGYCGSTGVLSDQERTMIRQLGIPLTGGAMEGVRAEFAEIYGVFCGAEESVSVFCPNGQPSYLFRRLAQLRGSLSKMDPSMTFAISDEIEAAAYLVGIGEDRLADELDIADAYKRIDMSKTFILGRITRERIEELYGDQLYLSASQVDKLADCRFSYFLKYGLRLKERKPITVDPAEFGTFVHAVLEKTAAEVMDLGGFSNLTLEQTLAISDRHANEYMMSRFEQLDSHRIAYLLQRNSAELKLVVKELWEELQASAFAPVGFEVAFGDKAQMAAIPISGQFMDARLRGFVDRVDAWKLGENTFYRVVDYKTGRKDFDYCDIFNGYGLQMLLYLFALQDAGEALLGSKPIPAGVQYFPARIPVITADGQLTEEDSAAAREKALKRKGLLLNDELILQAMEPGEKPRLMNYTRRKDGSLTGDLASVSQLSALKTYIFLLLGRLIDDVASGCVEPNPYTRGSSHNACTFCPFGSVCHSNDVCGRRNYRAMSAQRFWEEIEKELNGHG